MENWKDIKGYEGLYQVSDKGRVKRLEREVPHKNKSTRTLREKYLGFVHNEYLKVGLSKNGKTYHKLIHRLVAIHFVPNPFSKPLVHHKDHDKQNPNASNLEWVTYAENSRYASEAGRLDGRAVKRGMSFEQANRIRDLYNSGRFTTTELAPIYGCSVSTVYNIVMNNSYNYK